MYNEAVKLRPEYIEKVPDDLINQEIILNSKHRDYIIKLIAD